MNIASCMFIKNRHDRRLFQSPPWCHRTPLPNVCLAAIATLASLSLTITSLSIDSSPCRHRHPCHHCHLPSGSLNRIGATAHISRAIAASASIGDMGATRGLERGRGLERFDACCIGVWATISCASARVVWEPSDNIFCKF